MKPTAVPSVFSWTKKTTQQSSDRSKRAIERAARQSSLSLTTDFESHDSHMEVTSDELFYEEDMTVCDEIEISDAENCASSHTQSVQTETVDVCESSTQTLSHSLEVKRFCATEYETDPRAFQFYTGLDNYAVFLDVYASLGPAVTQLHYKYGTPSIEPQDQLFLTLVKLRTHKTNYELSILFKVKELEVYNTFITWIRFMSLQWREINIWPEREIVNFHTPSDFKRRFPRTRAIFDATECPVKKPSLPATQQVTFSTYKNRNTVKVLIGITPGGQVSYVSSAYGGSTSDRQIVERSNLTNICDPTDSLMADKGFDVQDIFAPFDVTVNIPTFFKKRNRMAGSTVLKDRSIASKRVHVERVIGYGKTYKILTQPLNQTESLLSSDIIYVCYMLVNFRRCIVPKNA